MNREPINKQNLSDAVAEKLREYIRSSDAPRSLKLPPEAVIGESMGASRITVRRALSDLEQEGLIQRIHGRGTFINPNISKIMPPSPLGRICTSLSGKAATNPAMNSSAWKPSPPTCTTPKRWR